MKIEDYANKAIRQLKEMSDDDIPDGSLVIYETINSVIPSEPSKMMQLLNDSPELWDLATPLNKIFSAPDLLENLDLMTFMRSMIYSEIEVWVNDALGLSYTDDQLKDILDI